MSDRQPQCMMMHDVLRGKRRRFLRLGAAGEHATGGRNTYSSVDGKYHIPSDLVVDRWVSDVEGSSFLDFPFLHDVWSYDPSQNKLSDINRLNLYH